MKIAVMYESLTGNTELLANTIKNYYQDEIVYFGNIKEEIDADVYFIGSWTDKGNCCEKTSEFLKKLNHKKIAYFSTAGFHGLSYYDKIWENVNSSINETNIVLGHFICQGKMSLSVKERYEKMLIENPDNKQIQMSIRNFHQALSHPDVNDIENILDWLKGLKL